MTNFVFSAGKTLTQSINQSLYMNILGR